MTDNGNEFSFVDLIREKFTPVRVVTTWIGEERTLDDGTRQTLANIVGAQGRRIKASKKIIDTTHDKYTACTQIRSQARTYLKRNSRAFEGSVRLALNDDVDEIFTTILQYSQRLEQAAMDLQYHFDDVVRRSELGDLYDTDDYANFRNNVAAEFSLSMQFPSIEPNPALRMVSESAARAAYARANARIQDSVVLAEQEFANEFQRIVSHFIEMMGFDENGNPRKFQPATVDNVNKFFERFRRFDIGSSPQLGNAIDAAQQALGDTNHTDLKHSDRLRRIIREDFEKVNEQLSAVVTGSDVDRLVEFDD